MFCVRPPEDQGLSNQESFQKRTKASARPSRAGGRSSSGGAARPPGEAAAALRLPRQHSPWRGAARSSAVICGRDVGTALSVFG